MNFQSRRYSTFSNGNSIQSSPAERSPSKAISKFCWQFDSYTQSLVDDGAIVTASRLSSTLKVFLGQVIVETKEFSQTTELAVCVRKFKVEYNLKRVTIAGYLAKIKKFMRSQRYGCR